MRFARSSWGLLVALLLTGNADAAHAPRVTGDTDEEADVGRAIEALKQDPYLKHEQKTERRLVRRDQAKKPTKDDQNGWGPAFFEFIARSARVAVWAAGAVLTALVVIWALRLARRRVPRIGVPADTPASHVQELDVRPASLPADIGAAATALLAAGQVREALSLLYRGALSRVIHRHGIAIAVSSTEGEVLNTVTSRLTAPGADYFARLVPLWQKTVYAAEPPAAAAVAALCQEFAVLESTPA